VRGLHYLYQVGPAHPSLRSCLLIVAEVSIKTSFENYQSDADGKRLVCYSCGSIQVEIKLKSLGLEASKFLEEASKANVTGSILTEALK
jgi:hypothetical protein